MLERRAARGLSTPALDSQPEMYQDLVPVWDSFWQLHSARGCGYGGAPQAITVADVAAMLDIQDVAQAKRAEWCRLICAMDTAWMGLAVEKRKRAQDKDAAKGRKDGNVTSRNRRTRSASRRR